jgi:hypothetical protein
MKSASTMNVRQSVIDVVIGPLLLKILTSKSRKMKILLW